MGTVIDHLGFGVMRARQEAELVLLPCPFCGGTDIKDDWDDYGNVMQECKDCDARGPLVGNTPSGPIRAEYILRNEARRLWNRRAPALFGHPVIETDDLVTQPITFGPPMLD